MTNPQRLLITLVFLLLSVGLCADQAKDKTPTLEQCRSDYKLWTAPSLSLSKKEWSIEVLNSRFKKMLYCETDYRDDPAERQRWMTLENEFSSIIGIRYMHFVDRHGLSNLFLEEDAKGER